MTVWRRAWLRWAMVVTGLLMGNVGVTAEVICWRAGRVQMTRADRAELEAELTRLTARPHARHIVAQFDHPLTAVQRAQLEQRGLKLLRYLGNHAFFAALAENGTEVSALSVTPFLSDVAEIETPWKVDPRITAGQTPEWAVVAEDPQGGQTVALYALFHPDVPLLTEAVQTVEGHGGLVRDELQSINGLVIELPAANISALADEDGVQWIEWPLPRLGPVNDSNRAIAEADIVQAPPYNLNGAGVTVLVYDSGTARASHLDFQGRLTVGDGTELRDHATHVAGTIGGAGVASSAYKGMAPGVTMLSYGFEWDGTELFFYSNPGDLEDDYDEAINVFGAVISNNSLGSNVEVNGFDCGLQGDYGVTSALIDAIVSGGLGEPFRIIWANGNERQGDRCDVEGFGDYYSMAPPAGAKNHIAVGALNSNDDSMTDFTSWGPTDDGRLRPDVCAPGCQGNGDYGVTSCGADSDTAYLTYCGTSMASPTVCGLGALFLEDFRAQFPGDPDPRNSTLKALLVHNAVDVFSMGPDYKSGYGSVRIGQTIDFMRAGNFLEDQVGQGGTFVQFITVSPGTEELKVTLAWDDEPGTPNVTPSLVNDLDLRVFDAASQRYYPWTLNPSSPSSPAIRTQPDHLNNLEQVLVDDPATGVWRIEVYGFDVPAEPQVFSLAASGPLFTCSSQGVIILDKARYGCTATAEIRVVDCDLDLDGEALDSVLVAIASDSEPGGETVLLTETGNDTADFRGTIPLDITDSSGVLLVTEGDTITATYIDADDGQGGFDIPVITTATVDCAGPVISNIQVINIDTDRAVVTYETGERATGTVRYSDSCDFLTESVTDSYPVTTHTALLTELNDGTPYYFAIDALDEQGNPATDDNGGACYTFSTLEILYDFPMNTNPGWSTEGQWAFGQPTGGGSVQGDPTAGHTGTKVFGYNLNGDYTNNLPATYLTTGFLDCSEASGTRLRFYRWLGIYYGTSDHAAVEVSNNGLDWVTVWEHVGNWISEAAWTPHTYDISAVADGEPEVYIRWVMGPTDAIITFPGWNIDDVQVLADGPPPIPTCDDGIQNQGEDRIDCGGPCPPCACTSDADCADGFFCNGVETCDAFGNCQSGTDVDCNDAVDCTVDSCNEETDSCDHLPDDAFCDNGLYCDGAETCNAVLDCQDSVEVDGEDPVVCTIDSCNEETDSCDHLPNDALCDNALYCDGAETCDPVLDCQDGVEVDCDDAVGCTVDSCNEETDSCDHLPDDALCDNGLYCDGAETCDPLLDCQDGVEVDCDDFVACTVDSCNEETDSCDHMPDDDYCDNGLYCDGVETCDVVLDCQSGDAINCGDGVTCTVDSCNEETDSCDHLPDDDLCDNGLYCDGTETCDPVLDCQDGTAVDCTDMVDCTIDSCNEATDQCDHIPDDEFCDNGLFCDGPETCAPSFGCEDGDPPCPPEKMCREYDDQCVDCLADSDCDDADPCTGRETCEVDGTCLTTLGMDCNGNGFEDYCDIAGVTSEDCNANDVPDECDIAEGTSADENDNGVPDECDAATPLPAAPPHDTPKNRYISFVPNNDEVNVALQVELLVGRSGADPVGSRAVTLGWVTMPQELEPGEYVARVVQEPVFREWAEGLVHLGDCEIVPAATYAIRATSNGEFFSKALEISTITRPAPKWWGDCIGEFDGSEWTAPNGIVSMDDVMATLQKFQHLPQAPHLTWVDVDGETPNLIVNMTDVLQVIRGFKGEEYPFSDPTECP